MKKQVLKIKVEMKKFNNQWNTEMKIIIIKQLKRIKKTFSFSIFFSEKSYLCLKFIRLKYQLIVTLLLWFRFCTL